ncbi:MAG: DUF2892 domain-containing protein [Thiotrichaceae bacterium]|nr:DUF2892 domain-containing protein [Thiotrichaceae bacterium]
MTIDKIILAVAGAVVLITAILGMKVNPNFLWVTAFVGLNLFQSAFTGFCPLAMILEKMGFKSS